MNGSGPAGAPRDPPRDRDPWDHRARYETHDETPAGADPYAPPPTDGGRGARWRRTGRSRGEAEGQAPGAVGVLRIGHRPGRDKRITTHVCLSARAFGADVVYIHEEDPRVVGAVQDVVHRFGGPFIVQGVSSWRSVLTAWSRRGAQIVHLTMYGIPMDEGLSRLDPAKPTLFVIGAEKVPPQIYEIADVNLAVGNQPHSELGAIAVVLDRFLGGDWAHKAFDGPVQVSPRERGKAVSQGSTP